MCGGKKDMIRLLCYQQLKSAPGKRNMMTQNISDLLSSENIIGVIESISMRWEEHVARLGRDEVHTGLWLGNLSGKYYFED
jgi:hypothetical protein